MTGVQVYLKWLWTKFQISELSLWSPSLNMPKKANIFDSFSHSAIQQFKEAFGIMDVDKDGLLTASDLVVRPKKLNIRMYTPFLAEKIPEMQYVLFSYCHSWQWFMWQKVKIIILGRKERCSGLKKIKFIF